MYINRKTGSFFVLTVLICSFFYVECRAEKYRPSNLNLISKGVAGAVCFAAVGFRAFTIIPDALFRFLAGLEIVGDDYGFSKALQARANGADEREILRIIDKANPKTLGIRRKWWDVLSCLVIRPVELVFYSVVAAFAGQEALNASSELLSRARANVFG